jgi:hypothetical protein
MLHNILNTIGFGLLGIDPFTAIALLGMGVRKEKKYKITLFMVTYAALSIFIGAVLSTLFGVKAVNVLEKLIPSDNHPFWGGLELVISVVILVWTIKKICNPKTEEDEKSKSITGSSMRFVVMGGLFAVSCFTDPTYYAVILLGGQSENFWLATFLLTLWFVVCQFMSIAVYFAIQFGFVKKLTTWIDKVKIRIAGKSLKYMKNILYGGLLIVGIILLIDSLFFWLRGTYLF